MVILLEASLGGTKSMAEKIMVSAKTINIRVGAGIAYYSKEVGRKRRFYSTRR